jgi:Tannase and feruloyl esterase
MAVPRFWRALMRLAGVAALVLLSCASVAAARSTHHSTSRANRQLIADSHRLDSMSASIAAPPGACAALATNPKLVSLRYPTAISSTSIVNPPNAAPGNPSYCDVQGMIAPQTQFEMKLPLTDWQGRYLQNGCGGYCGTISQQNFPTCDATLGGDFAMATDNEGHTSGGNGLGEGGLWAFDSQKLRDEYGYESEHELRVVAQTILTDFYGQPPQYSYFDGCSDGGREAMDEAERYPADFNGIIAGAPEIIAGPLNAENQTWDVRVNTDANGNAILTDNLLPYLHDAVLAACANDDGTSDGIITDPQACSLKLGQILQSVTCPSSEFGGCLTPSQATVAREIYDGPNDPQGRLLYPGGMPLGSEMGWSVFELPFSFSGGEVPTTQSLDYFGLSLPYLRFQLRPIGQLGPDPFQWQFTDQDFRSMFPVANTWDAMSTDLRAFYHDGGKLLMWQGWGDNGIPPTGTVDYHDTLSQRMGSNTSKFARLFLFPGVYHCGGGYISSSFDVVFPMVQWVENGTAPSQIVASDTLANNSAVTRPVYPYPEIPKYNGNGADPSAAASFHPVTSSNPAYTDWLGNYLFYQPVGSGRQSGGGGFGD